MDTTLLNELELLTSKYAGGDEILREMYRLTDQGGRRLGLRYDLTIPFAKVIALNPGMEFPFKRYEIGKVFRDGPVKKAGCANSCNVMPMWSGLPVRRLKQS